MRLVNENQWCCTRRAALSTDGNHNDPQVAVKKVDGPLLRTSLYLLPDYETQDETSTSDIARFCFDIGHKSIECLVIGQVFITELE